jgi:hypothetical protein
MSCWHVSPSGAMRWGWGPIDCMDDPPPFQVGCAFPLYCLVPMPRPSLVMLFAYWPGVNFAPCGRHNGVIASSDDSDAYTTTNLSTNLVQFRGQYKSITIFNV